MSVHLSDLLSQRAALTPSREAIVSPSGHWTFAEFDERSSRLALHLSVLGIGEGDRVAVLAKNSDLLATAVFAAARVNATVVVLNWRLQPAELDYILSDSTPSVLLYDSTFASTVNELIATRPGLALIRDGEGGTGTAFHEIVAVATATAPVSNRGRTRVVPAVIMYTSGTTGRPKGAMLGHAALVAAAQGNSATLDWRRDDRFLLVAPMFHIGGLCPLFTNVLVGSTTVLLSDFDPVHVWKIIGEERITSMMSVPVMLQALLATLSKAEGDIDSLRWVTCGASYVPKSLIEQGMALGISIQQVYGITEFAGALTFWTPEMGLDHASSQGKPLMFGELMVVDPTTLEDVPTGRDGEIWCRGPMLFDGYWNNEAATRAVMHNGWYRSGDVGKVDKNGFVYLVDRIKDMIISGGENIYSAELEAVLGTVAGVADVAVIGRPDERWGEIPIAYVVRKPGAVVTEEDIVGACRAKLASYKCVKGVRFVDALPRNAVGKVLKHELRKA